MSETIFPGVAVFMIDGFDIDYYYGSEMPVMNHMARQGFFKTGSCIFPSLTNANNISIACGSWPDQHGVTTNCYFDKVSGQARFLEDASFLKTPHPVRTGRPGGNRVGPFDLQIENHEDPWKGRHLGHRRRRAAGGYLLPLWHTAPDVFGGDQLLAHGYRFGPG